jgi:hypothetical protein
MWFIIVKKKAKGVLFMISVRKSIVYLIFVMFMSISFSGSTTAVSVGTETKLVASDPTIGSVFGSAVAISGNNAVVGDYDTSSAYVYHRGESNWYEEAILTVTGSKYLGHSVAVDGDTILIGDSGDSTKYYQMGAAYVFVRSGTSWIQQAKLAPSDGLPEDRFGVAVAVQGDTAVVGSHLSDEDDYNLNSGAVYVYQRTGSSWNLRAKLTRPDPQRSGLFGVSVDIDGDTIAVGSSGDNTAARSSGAAYIFVRSGTGWNFQAKVIASNPSSFDDYGRSISIEGDTMVVGAFNYDAKGMNSGAAFVYQRTGTTWALDSFLTASDGEVMDKFGLSVSLSGDIILAGAIYDDDADPSDPDCNSGATYVFQRVEGVWTEKVKITPRDTERDDQFGYSVSVDGTTAIIGAPEVFMCPSYGSAYICEGFDLVNPNPNDNANDNANEGGANSNSGLANGYPSTSGLENAAPRATEGGANS